MSKKKTKLPQAKPNVKKTNNKIKAMKIGFKMGLLMSSTIVASKYFNEFKWEYQFPVILQSPVVIERRVKAKELISPIVITPTPTPKAEIIIGEGEASYYSVDGCIGCRADRKMANTEVLNDSKLTVALTPEDYRAYKNQTVIIENLANGKKIKAKVTDTGGFKKYKRVADMSLATKNAIDCEDLCDIKVYKEIK